MSSIITIHEEAPNGGALPHVGKTPMLALRMLIKNDLDLDGRVDTLDTTQSKTILAMKTDTGRRTRRTAYIGPPDAMLLLLGVIGWYMANANEPPTRSRVTSELLAAIDANLANQNETERLRIEWCERFKSYVDRVA